jgi:integrase
MGNTRKTRKHGAAAEYGADRKSGNTAGGAWYESDRKHLTGGEVKKLIDATKGDRNEARDRCLLLLMFRHDLHVSEACRLKLDQVDTEDGVLHVSAGCVGERITANEDIDSSLVEFLASQKLFEFGARCGDSLAGPVRDFGSA